MKSFGVGLLLFTFAQVLFSQQPNVEITKAIYGAGDKQVDVTEWVRVLVSNGSAIETNNELTGSNDPAFGQVKTLTIQYVENGVRKTATAKEGETLKYGDTVTTNKKQSPAPESSARPESESGAVPSVSSTPNMRRSAQPLGAWIILIKKDCSISSLTSLLGKPDDIQICGWGPTEAYGGPYKEYTWYRKVDYGAKRLGALNVAAKYYDGHDGYAQLCIVAIEDPESKKWLMMDWAPREFRG